MAFDPLNLLLLAIAVVVFWRLRSVLGMRTGNERPPAEPYAPPKPEAETGKVLRFPKDDKAECSGVTLRHSMAGLARNCGACVLASARG